MNKLNQKLIRYSGKYFELRKQLYTSVIVNRVADTVISSHREIKNNVKSSLFDEISMKIQLSGPVSIAYYMKQVLTHPTKGYYISKDVFGAKGDFITSPEISQLFGEMIAVWILYQCKQIHKESFQIIELGPGRGTLSRDILRVFRQLHMSNKISLHLVEVSPVLSEIQHKMLCSSQKDVSNNTETTAKYYKRGITEDNVEVFWYKSIIDIPQGFSVFIAHEFFDALPIHKFQKTKDGWFEVLIDIDKTNKNEERFKYVLLKTDMCDILVDKNEKKDHIEISPQAVNIMRYISSAITQCGGFALIVDYGHDGDKTDTFRAFRKHKQCDPLLEPGSADLTADVNFAILKQVAQQTSKLITFGPINQNDFLTELGINIRLMNLLKVASSEQRKLLEQGYNKIMNSEEMGSCFKVLSMFPYVLKDYLKNFPVSGFQSYKHDNES